MNAWWALILVPLIGIIWYKIRSRDASRKPADLIQDGMLPNVEGMEWDGIHMNQFEDISTQGRDPAHLSKALESRKAVTAAQQYDSTAECERGNISQEDEDLELSSSKELKRDTLISAKIDAPPASRMAGLALSATSTLEASTFPGSGQQYEITSINPQLRDEETNTTAKGASLGESNYDLFADDVSSEIEGKGGTEGEEDVEKEVSSDDVSLSDVAVVDHENLKKTVVELIEHMSKTTESAQKQGKLSEKQYGPTKVRRFINLEHCMYDLVWRVARMLGMRKSHRGWDIMWIDVEAGTKSKQIFMEKFREMREHQLISHFPGFWSLSSKDLLVRNLRRMQKYYPREFSVFPKSWILPRDALQLSVYARNHKWTYFIAKPVDSCAGNGIFVTRDIRLGGAQKMVYQLYIRPFLIDGYKFDFRVYVLVTSCDPLRIYVHNEGLTRFATVNYEEPSESNSGDVFMHLTNTCVNTRNPSFVTDEFTGHSRRMSRVFQRFLEIGVDAEKIQRSMDDAIIKTMIAVLPTLRHNYRLHFPRDSRSDKCFEIMGFDIMLDCHLNVHVLEVNPSPSFGFITGTPYEAEVKESVVRDTFRILEGNIINKSRNRKEPKEQSKSAQFLVEWEKSHMGGFRKVYPPKPDLQAYYQKFIDKSVSHRYNLT